MSAAPPGLIETVRVRGGVAPLWPRHVARFAASAAALGWPASSLGAPPGGADRVVRFEGREDGTLLVSERPAGPTDPVPLATSAVPHPGYPHKTTARAAFDAARAEAASRGADDALLCTADGWVAEAGIWTLLWWEGERLAAPPLALGILPSVARARLAEVAGPILELLVTPADLAGRALLVANAARGVVPVARLDGAAVPPDPRTGGLAERFWP